MLHFCSVLGIAGGSGNNFPTFLDSYSEAVGFLGGCSVAMSHHLDFQNFSLHLHSMTLLASSGS